MPSIEVSPRESYEVNKFPDECPVCHRHVHVSLKLAHLVGKPREYLDPSRIEAVFLCPSDECNSFFIAYFRENRSHQGGHNGTFAFSGASPRTAVRPTIFDGIKKLSPSFAEIFTQATEADQRRLDQVAGVGYRKALEFLIKDYCCAKRPEEAEVIKATALGPCIDRFVSDENIKDCAKLAVWLGNDETHYVRKWTDKDVDDLKLLIGLTLSWIETSIKTDQYRATMLKKSM